MHIALATLLLSFFLMLASPSFSQTYTNKDIEVLKGQKQEAPSYHPPVKDTKKQTTVKETKKQATGKNTGGTPPGGATSGAKDRPPGKPVDGINYSSPEGTIKIEVKSNKNSSAKSNTAQKKPSVPSTSRTGGKPADTPKPGDLAVLDDVKVTNRMLPYEDWKSEYEDYFYRHYNDNSLSLVPTLLVIRSTGSRSPDDIINLFKRGSLYDEGNEGAVFGHLSCHFLVGRSGEIVQTMPLNIRSKGAYGVNNKAITIEVIGLSNQEIIKNETQKQALYELVTSLMKNLHIPLSRVYGHYEVAQGKKTVPDYTEFDDSDYRDSYSPDKACYDPGEIFMQQLRNHFARSAARGQ